METSTECREEPAVIDAQVQEILIEHGAEVTFTCDGVARAEFSADPEVIDLQDSGCTLVSLSIYGPDDTLMPAGQQVSFQATHGELSGTEEIAAGQWEVDLCLSSCPDEPVEVTATVNGQPLDQLDSPASLTIDTCDK